THQTDIVMLFVVDDEAGRIYQNGAQVRVFVTRPAEQQQTGVRGDGDPNLVRDGLTGAADEFLAVDEALDELAQLALLVRPHALVHGQGAAQDLQPGRRERGRVNLFASVAWI